MLWNERKIFDYSFKIDASIDEFGAFPPVEGVFDVRRVMEQELVNIEGDIILLSPIKVERELVCGGPDCVLSRAPDASTSKEMGDVEIDCDTDISLVHVRRMLYYSSTHGNPKILLNTFPVSMM